jgi:hypothetical protein
MSSDFSSSFASASSIMATADLRLRALKCKVLGWITSLDFKLKEVQGSITSLEIAMEELGSTLRSSSIVMQSLTQTHQYLDSQCQELVEEMSDMAAIADNLEADFPFADTADIHVSMLMMRRGLLCSTYNEQISTIDDLITYINNIQPLGSDPKHVVPKEESTPNRKAS